MLETEEKHREYAESLRGQIGALDELQKKVCISFTTSLHISILLPSSPCPIHIH